MRGPERYSPTLSLAEAITDIGPPPSTPGPWFPAASWYCSNGHWEMADIVLAVERSTCVRCKEPLMRHAAGWVRGEYVG